VGCEANHFFALLAVAASYRAASMAGLSFVGRKCRVGPPIVPPRPLSLDAALETRSGEILGKTAPRHTSPEFVDFLAQVVVSKPPGREIHVIADNLATQNAKLVDEFPARYPQIHIHFTPPILRG
jgi:DDE superfamily endonuclease